jgi:hypothetical protein
MRTDAEEEPLEIGRHRAEWVLVGPDDERMWLIQTVQSIQTQPNTVRKLPNLPVRVDRFPEIRQRQAPLSLCLVRWNGLANL